MLCQLYFNKVVGTAVPLQIKTNFKKRTILKIFLKMSQPNKFTWSLVQVSEQWAGRRGRTFGLQLPTARRGRCPAGRARHRVDLIRQLHGGGQPASEGRRAGKAGGLTTGRPCHCPLSLAAGPRLGRVGSISVWSLHCDSLGDGGAGK